MNGSQDLRRAYRETAVACGAMLASVVIYAVVVEVLGPRLSPAGAGGGHAAASDGLRYAFYLLAGAGGLVIPGVRRLAETGVRSGGPARLRVGALVAASLAEAPAVLGLVLFILTGRRADFYLFAAWSLLLQLFHFPRYEQWEEATRTRRPG